MNIQAITDNVTLDYDSSTYHVFTLTAASAKDCTLPALKNGYCIYIRNDSASNQTLNVKEPAGSTTVLSLSATGEGTLFVSDGSSWKVLMKGT